MDDNKLWKIRKEMGIPDHFAYLLRNLLQIKEQQLEPDMQQQTGSKLGKEYVKAVYCHVAWTGWSISKSQDFWKKYQ